MLISGTWNPSTISTITPGSYDYTFTPTPGQNAFSVVKTITIIEPVTPTFTTIPPICKNDTAPFLPQMSTNSIQGEWSPAVIDTSTTGFFTYTFTPNTGECANSTTVTIEIIDCNPTITSSSIVECEITEGEHPKIGDDNINDDFCLKVCENSIINYFLTGDTSNISNTEWNILGGSIINQDNGNCEIEWNGSNFAFIEATITFINGFEITIQKCVEKLVAPEALFEVVPYNAQETVYSCVDTPVSFNNLSNHGSGNGQLYYNWDFGDGNTSTQFEPTHTYTHTGTYTVSLTVFNGCSCTDSYEMELNIIEGLKAIECVGVICENEIGTYTIESECGVHFEAIGGEIVSQENNEAIVLWDNVQSSGFGTLIASCSEGCTSVIQIPVVQNLGTIEGSLSICESKQQTYRLPQWPSTDFTWSIDDGGTGATIILNNQRNEIVVQAQNPGTLILYCNYVNTLLGCGGTAELTIEVVSSLCLMPNTPMCVNDTQTFQFVLGSTPLTQPINYIVEGPDNFYLSGTGTEISLSPALEGVYGITLLSGEYCVNEPIDPS